MSQLSLAGQATTEFVDIEERREFFIKGNGLVGFAAVVAGSHGTCAVGPPVGVNRSVLRAAAAIRGRSRHRRARLTPDVT